MVRFAILIAVGVVASASELAKAETPISNGDRFRLFAFCLPVEMAITPLHDDTTNIGLTEELCRVALQPVNIKSQRGK